MKLAIVGVTGMVGQEMIKVLEEFNFEVTELIPVASEKSVGTTVTFKGKEYTCVGLETAVSLKPQIAIFSAGGDVSLAWAEKFAANGTTVIDNSSAWRMDPTKKLVVPEINAHLLTANDKIIANPNCSTIQLVLTMAPLHQKYGIKRAVVSTYQSITGTGVKAVRQLENEMAGTQAEMVYPYPIHKNCLPHCDDFTENGYTKEEMKLTNETKKILDESINVTATAVRVPVVGGHSESVNIEFNQTPNIAEIRQLLHHTEGITLKDNPETNTYPMPIYAAGKNDVFVGRIRLDESQPNTINLWIVADNIRKGAATNAVQIAKYLVEKELV
ncbi:aspartate-semialdehyde dehydrogenase [Putridiphycobacter roseus]|uniref:Aspartate-semialdehyde dehydrogenase n=1 Tax=Putridiphycobacter roseus TaxID=2219161 RepID=A0A2W1NBK1_9FLAO|nr:aspartate-semialdehyde dehydrogenase [Putridiphycobacter roseus]PZE16463.1 aspartate-semialdehyde dehydrogenase [Putridiphycobacter roseus]